MSLAFGRHKIVRVEGVERKGVCTARSGSCEDCVEQKEEQKEGEELEEKCQADRGCGSQKVTIT